MLFKVSIPNRFQFRMIPNLTALLTGQYGEIHYIGGTEVLPTPYSPEEEADRIAAMTEDESGEIRSDLVEHNLRLVAHIIKKYYSNTSDQDDLISIGTIGLIKAINTFRADKNIKLATYASRCIENEKVLSFGIVTNKTMRRMSLPAADCAK